MPAHHDIAAEIELWNAYADSAFKDDAEPVFHWTQYAGHGPGPELLGDPETVLEIGCGTGRALAHLAQQGVKATGVDLSPVMVDKIRERWGRQVRSSTAPKLSTSCASIRRRTTRSIRSSARRMVR